MHFNIHNLVCNKPQKQREEREGEGKRGKRKESDLDTSVCQCAIEIESGNSQFNLTTLEQQFTLEKQTSIFRLNSIKRREDLHIDKALTLL